MGGVRSHSYGPAEPTPPRVGWLVAFPATLLYVSTLWVVIGSLLWFIVLTAVTSKLYKLEEFTVQ